MITIALRFLALSIGAVALYAAVFMYEDQEGRWQNRIEKLWVVIHDRARLTGSKTSAFFNSVAAVVTRVFDWMFGRRMLSFRFIGVSSCYSLAGGYLLGFLVFIIMFRPSNPLGLNLSKELAGDLQLVKWAVFVGGVVLLILAILPSLLRSRWPVVLSLFPIVFSITGVLLDSFRVLRHKHLQLPFFGALLLSLLSDILLLVLVRFTLHWISTKTNVFRIAVAILIQVGVFLCLIVVPLTASSVLTDTSAGGVLAQTSAPQILDFLAIFNVFTGLASSLFLMVLLFVLLHRVFWPVLGKLFYPLARYELIRNKKFLFSVGIVCVVFALSWMNPFFKVVQSLVK
jgi:hypothetical protein